MGGGSGSSGPSVAEMELQKAQTSLLRDQQVALKEQQRIEGIIAPFLFEDAGLTPQFDPDDPTRIIGFDRVEDPFEERNLKVQDLLLQRTEAALKGELPLNPGLIADLDEQEKTLKDILRRNLGPGFETSTPGIQAIAEFNERKTAILDAARKGDLTLSEQLISARELRGDAIDSRKFGQIVAAAGNPLAGINTGVNLSQSFGSLSSGLAQRRLAQDQLKGGSSGIGQGIGSIVGAIAGSIIAPGIGTVLGGALGGAAGGAIEGGGSGGLFG